MKYLLVLLNVTLCYSCVPACVWCYISIAMVTVAMDTATASTSSKGSGIEILRRPNVGRLERGVAIGRARRK